MLDLSLANAVAWAAQVAVIGVAAVVLPLLLRITAPGARLLYLRAALIACLVLPLAQPWVPQIVTSTPGLDVGLDLAALSDGLGAAGSGSSGADATRAAITSNLSSRWPLPLVVGALYVTGVALRLAWIAIGFVYLRKLRRTSTPLSPRPATVEDAALLAGVDAEFRVSTRIVHPVTFGVRRAVVLVPPGFDAFDAEQQTAIAAHELLHVARRDWLRTIADELLLSVCWFHPALWWLVRQIHLSIEQVVDRDVVARIGVRKPYLEALLKLAAAGPTPVLQPAAAFLKHGHLAQRVALLVKEGTMSRVRLVSSFALALAMLLAGGWYTVQAFPLTASVVAVASAVPSNETGAGALVPVEASPAASEATPAGSDAGALAAPDAPPATMAGQQQTRPGVAAVPQPPPPPPPAGTANTPAPFDLKAWERKIQETKTSLLADSNSAALHYTLGAYYWDRAFRDRSLPPSEVQVLLSNARAELDQALGLKTNYVEAMLYKNLVLRLEASTLTDTSKQQALIAQADALIAQAGKLGSPARSSEWDAIPANAVRVGGNIKPPVKVKDVKPKYPETALNARVQGVVIIEAVIGGDGKVQATRVLRSIPLLDQAALDAVGQWEFSPTLMNGTPVPVIMTVTVNFTVDSSPQTTGVAGGVAGGVPGGAAGGVGGGVAGGVAGGLSAPGAAADNSWAKSIAPDAIRVGGNVAPPTRTKYVRPDYPAEAKNNGVQGIVIIEAVIGPTGAVTNARVVRSVPGLDDAAIASVKQWEFAPTLLNGNPVSVIMTVTVNFTLQ